MRLPYRRCAAGQQQLAPDHAPTPARPALLDTVAELTQMLPRAAREARERGAAQGRACASVMPSRMSTGTFTILSGNFSARSSMLVPPARGRRRRLRRTSQGDSRVASHSRLRLGQPTSQELSERAPAREERLLQCAAGACKQGWAA